MKKIVLLIIIMGGVSCKGSKKSATSAEDIFVIENLAGMTAEDMKRNFTDANITEDIGVFDEGMEERAYTNLYPGTADEIQITWADAARTKIYDIHFSDSGKWKSNTGIKVGSTYEELNKMNGKEISFYGFGWDYSGAVTWNNGKLENSNIIVFLEAQNIPGKYYGDHIVKATPEELTLMDPKVSTIMYKR